MVDKKIRELETALINKMSSLTNKPFFVSIGRKSPRDIIVALVEDSKTVATSNFTIPTEDTSGLADVHLYCFLDAYLERHGVDTTRKVAVGLPQLCKDIVDALRENPNVKPRAHIPLGGREPSNLTVVDEP